MASEGCAREAPIVPEHVVDELVSRVAHTSRSSEPRFAQTHLASAASAYAESVSHVASMSLGNHPVLHCKAAVEQLVAAAAAAINAAATLQVGLDQRTEP